MADTSLWQIALSAPERAAPAFEAVLETHCLSVSRFIVDEGAGLWRVEGLAAEVPDRGFLETVLAAIAGDLGVDAPVLDLEPVQDRDWVVETVHAFPPVMAGRFFLYGSHFEGAVPPGRIGLHLDAGAAFGSGEHPTTRGCLLALDDLAHRTFNRPLDMGCGSGVLALAIARIWRVPVLAVDLDPRAVDVARDNARINGRHALIRAVTGGGYRGREVRGRAPFDLVTANILANPLIGMARDLAKSLAPGGVAVLSGLLADDARRVLEAHHRVGLRLIQRMDVDGWSTLILGKRPVCL